jgi:hypothetical protein
MFFYMIQIDTQDRSNNTEEILTIPDHLFRTLFLLFTQEVCYCHELTHAFH